MRALALFSIALYGLFWVLSYIKANHLSKFYVFDKDHLQSIVQSVLDKNQGANSTKIIHEVYSVLKQEYGDYIADYDGTEWVFSNHGNAMGSMLVLHASISEYLMFFGTAVGTEGHTGTHFADDYFTILYGKETASPANARVREVYLPGDQHHLPSGHNKQYSMPPNSWALELAQGWIPTMLPFGMLESLTSTMDFWSLFKTIRLSATHMTRNLLKGKF
jgi:C-8 sterol isomerase